jgi:hypothetical protein
MAARVHRPLRVIELNANGIWRQRCELTKELQYLNMDVGVFSEIHHKPHEWFLIPNYHFIGLAASREEKAEMSLRLEKAFCEPIV